jgi:hypothetical protein
MTVDELRTQLESGSSIAEIATTKSIDVNTIIDALVAEAKTHLDQAVADGKVTQDEATKRLDDMRTDHRHGQRRGSARPTQVPNYRVKVVKVPSPWRSADRRRRGPARRGG